MGHHTPPASLPDDGVWSDWPRRDRYALQDHFERATTADFYRHTLPLSRDVRPGGRGREAVRSQGERIQARRVRERRRL